MYCQNQQLLPNFEEIDETCDGEDFFDVVVGFKHHYLAVVDPGLFEYQEQYAQAAGGYKHQLFAIYIYVLSTALIYGLQSLLDFGTWLAIRAFRRYKEQVVDPEKEHLAKQNEKLRNVNRKLTDRNLDLAKKLEALRSQYPDAKI